MLTTASVCGHVWSECYRCGLNESLSCSANRKLGFIHILFVVVEVILVVVLNTLTFNKYCLKNTNLNKENLHSQIVFRHMC